VKVDEQGVSCHHPSGEIESVAWKDLYAVVLETNDTGPWGMDMLWRLFGPAGAHGCVIPMGATGEKELLARLQALSGFDNEQLIAALSWTENQIFVCWRRAADS
jgi:hypothetical protein